MRRALWLLTLLLASHVLAQEAAQPTPEAATPREGYRPRQSPTAPQPANKAPRRARQEDFTNGFYTADIRRQVVVLHDYTALLPEVDRSLLPDLSALLAPPPAESSETTALLPALPAPTVALPPKPIQIALGDAQVGGESRPAIALHPRNEAEVRFDLAAASFKRPISEWARVFLFVRVGLADPVEEDDANAPATGMRYAVLVNDQPVAAAVLNDRVWRLLAIDLTDLAPATTTVSLFAGLDGTARPAAVCFTDVRIAEVKGPFYLVSGGRGITFGFSTARFPRSTPGIALAQVKNDVSSEVLLSMGASQARFNLEPGIHWLPLEFNEAGHFGFKPISGDIQLFRVDMAPQPKPFVASEVTAP